VFRPRTIIPVMSCLDGQAQGWVLAKHRDTVGNAFRDSIRVFCQFSCEENGPWRVVLLNHSVFEDFDEKLMGDIGAQMQVACRASHDTWKLSGCETFRGEVGWQFRECSNILRWSRDRVRILQNNGSVAAAQEIDLFGVPSPPRTIDKYQRALKIQYCNANVGSIYYLLYLVQVQ
jgi:hypothetical protein